MFSYIDRDLIRSFILAFLVVVAFVQIGYLVSIILQMASDIFAGGESKLGWLMLYYLFSVPRQFAYTIPVGTAMSVLWVYTVKARQNELLAYMAGGVSPLRIAAPFLVMGGLLSVGCFLTIEYLAHPGDRAAQRIEAVNIQGKAADALTRERNVFQKGEGNRFFNIRSFDPTREVMEIPIIIDMGTDWNQIDWRLDARRAERVQEGENAEWIFREAVYRKWNSEGVLTEYRAAPSLSESELGQPLEADLTKYLRQRFRPAQMSTMELIDYISLFKLQNKPSYRLQTNLYFNFAIPLGSLILTLLMCAHVLRPSSAGVVAGFGGGLVYIAFYYLILLGARVIALSGYMSPLLAAIAPNALFLLFGIWMLNRYRAL